MSAAYVDSSILVAIAFQEEGSEQLVALLDSFDRLACSNLGEAELRSACYRERMAYDPGILSDIEWVMPARTLSEEIADVLATGYSTGADVWHLATSLFYTPEPREISFLTLDIRQRSVAEALGFRVELANPSGYHGD